jgi:acyl carrier protein
MSVLARLQQIMGGTFNLNPLTITEGTRQADVASWDSLGHVNLMVALESTFEVELEPEDFPRLTSVRAILTYLQARGIA